MSGKTGLYLIDTNYTPTIEASAFFKCESLSSINVDDESMFFTDIDGVLFDKQMKTLIKYPSKKSDKSFIIPDSVTKIEASAFYGCDFLTSIKVDKVNV